MNGEAGLVASLRLDHAGFSLQAELSLPARGVSALFGASGSGKTTCLRCIAGLEPRSIGRIAFGGDVWQDSAEGRFVAAHRRPIGMVFQDTQLFAHLDVRANITYGQKRVAAADRRIGLDEVVALLGIGRLLERRTAGLSGGERQRVAIARALLTSPKLLLLDEPLAALDDARKAEVLPYLERLHDELALPMVYVSHSINEVARLADHLVLLDHGRVMASGTPHDLSARPDLPLAARDDAAVVLEGRVVEHDAAHAITRVEIAAGRSLWVLHAHAEVGRRVRLQIAARDVSVALDEPQRTSVLNLLPAVITARHDDAQGRSLLQLDASGVPLLARITLRSAALLDLQTGQAVIAQVKGIAVLG